MDPYATDYKPVHQMAASTARMIEDGELAIVGIGLPLVAATLARALHAPNATILFEGGAIGARSDRMPWSIADSACSDYAVACMEVWRVLSDMQAGYIDVGILGGAQIDRYGNLNSTVIMGQGDYEHPKVRMPGSGGSNDIATSCGRTIIMMRLRDNNFVPEVDYVTSPGFLDGGDARRRLGLRGAGPAAVITDKALFRFDPVSKEMFLSEISGQSTVEEISDLVGWELKVDREIKTMAPPTRRHMEIMARFDPLNLVLGSSANIDLNNFFEYAKAMEGIRQSITAE